MPSCTAGEVLHPASLIYSDEFKFTLKQAKAFFKSCSEQGRQQGEGNQRPLAKTISISKLTSFMLAETQTAGWQRLIELYSMI